VVWDIFKNIGTKIQKLNLQNKLIYYEAIGVILSAIKEDKVLVEAIRVALNQLITGWKSFIASVDVNPDLLKQDETLLNISFFINVNEKLNAAIKDRYVIVFEVIFNEMIVIYNFYTNVCQKEFAQNKGCLTYYNFKKMRAVKRDILRMFSIFIEHSKDKQAVAANFLPPLSNILKAYEHEPEQLREAEMILLFSKVIEVFGPIIATDVPTVLQCIFGATLSLITKDFSSYPDHRVNFFIFLKTVVEKCFQALLSIPKEQLEIVINCMIWSIRHELTSIYEVGLESLYALIQVG
jgi:exportin-1